MRVLIGTTQAVRRKQRECGSGEGKIEARGDGGDGGRGDRRGRQEVGK